MTKDIASSLVAALLFIAPASANAQQDRLLLFRDESGGSVYVLPETVRRTSPAVTAWTRIDSAPTDPAEIRVRAQKAIYDCEGRTMTILRTEQYGRDGHRTSASVIPLESLRTFTPELGSTQHISMGIICALYLRR